MNASGDNNLSSITVVVAPEVWGFISREALIYDRQGLETGGIVVGRWLDSETVYLVGATGSGPQAEHGEYSFAVDTDFANAELENIRQANPGSDYVGEWHKHPPQLERPSYGDLMTARQLLADEDYPARLINPIITVQNNQAFCHFYYIDNTLDDFLYLKAYDLSELDIEEAAIEWSPDSTIYHAALLPVAADSPAPDEAITKTMPVMPQPLAWQPMLYVVIALAVLVIILLFFLLRT